MIIIFFTISSFGLYKPAKESTILEFIYVRFGEKNKSKQQAKQVTCALLYFSLLRVKKDWPTFKITDTSSVR